MDTDTASASGDGRGEPSRWPPDRRPRTGRVFVGLFVIGIGVVLLLDRLGHYDFHLSARLWPFVLILLGAARLADGAWDRTRGWISALWLIYVGGWGLLNEWHVFGFDYDFFLATGQQPGTVVEYQVTGGLEDLGETWARRAADLRARRRTRDVNLILSVLCRDGYVRPGRYIVTTDKYSPQAVDYIRLLRKTGTTRHEACFRFRRNLSRSVLVELAEIDNLWDAKLGSKA